MRNFEGIAGNLTDRLAAMGQIQQELLERLRLTGALGVQQGEQPRDGLGRTQQEARRDRLAFSKNRPTFERGRDRWSDFALRFEGARRDYGVDGDHAKWALYNAIVGQSSRLVIASMAPTNAAMHAIGFDEYLRRMGEKFTPAAESIQMEAEYRNRKQDKNEDVQNYINAKHELFQLAFPNAQARDRAEFYRETTEGFINKYIRDQMFSYEADNVEAFGARAVTMVQIERRRIKLGDSDATKLDGLIPVTRPIRDRETSRDHDAMEVDALYGPSGEGYDDDAGDEEECECAALSAGGFRGPCYYCTRDGHMIRNCPRKAAGLPRVGPPGEGGANDRRGWGQRQEKWRRPDQKERGGQWDRQGQETRDQRRDDHRQPRRETERPPWRQDRPRPAEGRYRRGGAAAHLEEGEEPLEEGPSREDGAHFLEEEEEVGGIYSVQLGDEGEDDEEGPDGLFAVSSRASSDQTAYVWGQLGHWGAAIKVMVDSGNLVGDLVSEELALELQLPYDPQSRKICTAATGGGAEIVGQCRPMTLYVAGLKEGLVFHPWVVRGLSHPANVGRHFLGQHGGCLEFGEGGGQLVIGEEKAKLIPKDAPATRAMCNSLEKRGGASMRNRDGHPGNSLIIWPRGADASGGHNRPTRTGDEDPGELCGLELPNAGDGEDAEFWPPRTPADLQLLREEGWRADISSGPEESEGNLAEAPDVFDEWAGSQVGGELGGSPLWAEIAAAIQALREPEGQPSARAEGPIPRRVIEVEEPEGQPEEERDQRKVVEIGEDEGADEPRATPCRRVVELEDEERAARGGQTDEDDEIQVLGARSGGIRLPRRATEAAAARDNRGKKLIHLGPGDGQQAVRRLESGAEQVQKVIVFQRRGRDTVAQVHEYWTTSGAPPSGADYDRMVKATKNLPFRYEDKMRMWAAVREIKTVAEDSGDRHMWATRDAVCRMAGWATPAWAAQEAGRQKAETAQLKKEVARLKREGEQEARAIAEMKREAELSQGLSNQNERLSKGLEAAETRIRELEAEKASRAAADREKEVATAKEKAEAEDGVRKMEQERDENKKAFKMCLAALQTATRKLKGLQAQQVVTAPGKKATREEASQTETGGELLKDQGDEGQGQRAVEPPSCPQGPEGYPDRRAGRIPRAQKEERKKEATTRPGERGYPRDGHQGPTREGHRHWPGQQKYTGYRRQPTPPPRDYWAAKEGTKRVKRDHRGDEKEGPTPAGPERANRRASPARERLPAPHGEVEREGYSTGRATGRGAEEAKEKERRGGRGYIPNPRGEDRDRQEGRGSRA